MLFNVAVSASGSVSNVTVAKKLYNPADNVVDQKLYTKNVSSNSRLVLSCTPLLTPIVLRTSVLLPSTGDSRKSIFVISCASLQPRSTWIKIPLI